MTGQDPQGPAASGPEPTPTVPPSEGSFSTPAGTALPIDTDERPELLVGAAFAGGLLAALILKRITGGRG